MAGGLAGVLGMVGALPALGIVPFLVAGDAEVVLGGAVVLGVASDAELAEGSSFLRGLLSDPVDGLLILLGVVAIAA